MKLVLKFNFASFRWCFYFKPNDLSIHYMCYFFVYFGKVARLEKQIESYERGLVAEEQKIFKAFSSKDE